MATKNLAAKTRPVDQPYETWVGGSGLNIWTWSVLKKYQTPEKEAVNPYARWFCFVTSPFCPEGEYGDTYVREITDLARRVYVDPAIEGERP